MTTLYFYVLTTGFPPGEEERRLRYIRPHLPPDVDVKVVINSGGPEFLDRARDFGTAKESMYRDFAEFDPTAVDAVVVSGALDPGLPELRSKARVPVIGPGEASLFVASVIGEPLTIITVDEHAVEATHQLLRQVPAKPEIVSIRSTETPVRAVMDDMPAARAALLEQCQRAVQEDGAGAIYLGCMIYSMIDVMDDVRSSVNVPVIDPLAISLSAALSCAESSR